MAEEVLKQVEIITPTEKAAEILKQQEQIISLLDETEQNLKTKNEISRERFLKVSSQMECAKNKLIEIRKKLTEITSRVSELKAQHCPQPQPATETAPTEEKPAPEAAPQ